MRFPTLRACAGAFTLCLLAAPVHAEPIWSASWAFSPSEFSVSPTTQLTLTAGRGFSGISGSSYLLVTNTWQSTAALPLGVTTTGPYTLTLTITDDTTQHSGSVAFSGVLGLANTGGPIWLFRDDFSGITPQKTVVDQHLYTVSVPTYTPAVIPPPYLPTTSTFGYFDWIIGVTITDVPEPSTLALSGLGLSLLGVGWWHRRRASRRRVPAHA